MNDLLLVGIVFQALTHKLRWLQVWCETSALSPQIYAAAPESKMCSLAVGSLQWLVYMTMSNACKAASYLGGECF